MGAIGIQESLVYVIPLEIVARKMGTQPVLHVVIVAEERSLR